MHRKRVLPEMGGAASSSAAASSSSTAPPKRVPIGEVVDDALELDAEALKRLLPDVKGVTVTVDNLWHNRILISYPTLAKYSDTKSISKSFGAKSKAGLTPVQAFRICARWCWTQHNLTTGEEIPYEFADADVD